METIDIINFLRNYYFISNESLRFNTLCHEDIKVLFPFIRTCKNPCYDKIKSGDIIGVYDKTNRIIYYENPHLICDFEIESFNEKNDEEWKLNIIDIQYLSKDELLKIRRKLRLLGRLKDAYQVNKIIREKKKEEPHEYRKRKNKIKKESYYD